MTEFDVEVYGERQRKALKALIEDVSLLKGSEISETGIIALKSQFAYSEVLSYVSFWESLVESELLSESEKMDLVITLIRCDNILDSFKVRSFDPRAIKIDIDELLVSLSTPSVEEMRILMEDSSSVIVKVLAIFRSLKELI